MNCGGHLSYLPIMKLNGIKNIIFDLGGVIIDIDPAQSYSALAELVNRTSTSENQSMEEHEIFLRYEKGLISSEEFRSEIRKLGSREITDEAIDLGWNKMLLDIPIKRIKLLEKLKQDYRLFVLSNTNEIHVTAFNKIVTQVSGQTDLADFFHNVHYSHLMLKRKPEQEIFYEVLQINNLKAEETLFVDDRADNVEAARQVGMKTFHVTPEQDILGYFSAYE